MSWTKNGCLPIQARPATLISLSWMKKRRNKGGEDGWKEGMNEGGGVQGKTERKKERKRRKGSELRKWRRRK
jgi:hypothetical protein